MLYYWHILDQEGLVQFTCVKLPSFMVANSKSFSLVSREARKAIAKRSSPDKKDMGAQLALQIGKLGKGVENLAEVAFNQEVEANEQTIMKYELELLLLDPQDDMDSKRIQIYEKRIAYLTKEVQTSKQWKKIELQTKKVA